jgi:hypothetical protein
MLYSVDIGMTLETIIVDIIARSLHKETISNLETFILAFLQKFNELLTPENFPILSDSSLLGNAENHLRSKTIGCDQHCPMCRK